jgi:transposase
MDHLGFKFAREELRITPAKVQRVHLMKEILKCPECEKTGSSVIAEGEVPKALLPHSPVSASLAAEVMYRKTKDYLPFYRMENDTMQLGAVIPRETSSSWFIKLAEKYLLPVYNELHKEQLKRNVLHADETTCQVLREDGRSPESTSYMWVYTTADDGLPQIVIYDYSSGRAGANAREYLKGFKGMLQCDGYAGYNLVDDVTLVICVAHLRRKFFEAIPASDRKKIKLLDINSEEAIKEPVIPEGNDTMSPAVIGVAYCNKLFYIERCIKDKTQDEKKALRRDLSLPVWGAFWEFVNSLHPVGGSKLDTAVKYALNHKEGFMNYMLDGSCDISNNRAERKCKNYALIRRNSLFHTSVKGAEASAVVSSIAETAAANNLNVYQYLYTLLLYMPDYHDEPAGINALLPWSPFIKEHCTGLRDTEKMTSENHPDLLNNQDLSV